MYVPCKCREGQHCPICEILDNHDKEIVSRIARSLNERMEKYSHSMHPTNDEVNLAWLLSLVSNLYGRITVQQDIITRWREERKPHANQD